MWCADLEHIRCKCAGDAVEFVGRGVDTREQSVGDANDGRFRLKRGCRVGHMGIQAPHVGRIQGQVQGTVCATVMPAARMDAAGILQPTDTHCRTRSE